MSKVFLFPKFLTRIESGISLMQWSPKDSQRYAWLPERLPERLPGAGAAAEWTAGGFLDIR